MANRPSYSTGIEMYIAKAADKKVILLADDPLPTLWQVNFSDYIVKNEDSLLMLLDQLRRDAG